MWQHCLITLIVECCIFTQVRIQAKESVCNPPKRVSNLSADVVIGGLIPVHAGGELKLNEPGVLWVEAMMYAIEEINNDPNLLQNITLGFDIRDSCNKANLALGAALDFMLLPSAEGSYGKNNSSCLCNNKNTSFPPVVAVVGGASSRISTTVSPLFSTDYIPQISYSSTSPTLSDKGMYRSFFRTIPSDVYQAEAIADILKHFNWTYVSIVVSDDEYGRNGLIALRERLKLRNFCIAEEALFSMNSNEETRRDSDNIIRRLQEDTRQKVVVLWCERPAAIEFFKTATGKLSNITWIGTESWGDNKKVKDEIDFELIGGMLGIVPFLGRRRKFDKHLENLTPKSTHNNPWLSEYWSQKFAKNTCVKSPSSCTKEQLPNALSLPPNKYANVMDAVYAIAHGLQSLKNSHPNLNLSTLDKKMLEKLVEHIRKVEFDAFSAKGKFMFTKHGDPHFGAYLIKNLQGNSTHKNFETIAQWNGENSTLEFEKNVRIQWNEGGDAVPRSRCSEICEAGFGFVRSSRECCWTCPKCQTGYFKALKGNVECEPCGEGYISNEKRTACVKVDEDYLTWGSPFSIVTFVFSFFGLVLVLFTIAIFRKYSKTAVVKASNREVSLVHLASHAFLFLLPVLYIGRPRVVTCVIRLLLFPVLFTFITAVMFLKTDRIVRIFNSRTRLTKRSRLLSNKVQFVLTAVLTLIPVIGTTIWLILRPLSVVIMATNDDKYIVYCENEESCQLVQVSYILMLALLCTYEAYHARKLPESFNEAKYICFSMFAFVLFWVGYIPVCLDITGSTKQFMTCLFIILINFMTVLLIYLPKLNIILLHPENNRHESFKKSTLSSCLKEGRRLSPVITSTTVTPNPKRSIEINENEEIESPETKVRRVSGLTDLSYGSNEQLVAQHLGLPTARRPSKHVSEFDDLERTVTSI